MVAIRDHEGLAAIVREGIGDLVAIAFLRDQPVPCPMAEDRIAEIGQHDRAAIELDDDLARFCIRGLLPEATGFEADIAMGSGHARGSGCQEPSAGPDLLAGSTGDVTSNHKLRPTG